jgi:acetyl esterase/lipase
MMNAECGMMNREGKRNFSWLSFIIPHSAFIILCALCAHGQSTPVLLWPQGAPGALGTDAADKPTLTPFPLPPDKANGAAVVICPGGGYGGVSTGKEGDEPAKWMNALGVTAFVLRYRVSPYRHPIEMGDGQRAVRWVRAHAKLFHVDPARVGMMGFSAGGHVASTVATHWDEGNPDATDSVDRRSCRPDFQILAYAVITMLDPYAHAGSRQKLLGDNPPEDLLVFLSNERQVGAKTPPAFLMHTRDDATVPFQNSQMYYDACLKAGVPARLRLYDHGVHGVGLADGKGGAPNLPDVARWTGECAAWMKELGFLSAPAAVRAPFPAAVRKARAARRDFLGRRVLPLR